MTESYKKDIAKHFGLESNRRVVLTLDVDFGCHFSERVSRVKWALLIGWLVS